MGNPKKNNALQQMKKAYMLWNEYKGYYDQAKEIWDDSDFQKYYNEWNNFWRSRSSTTNYPLLTDSPWANSVPARPGTPRSKQPRTRKYSGKRDPSKEPKGSDKKKPNTREDMDTDDRDEAKKTQVGTSRVYLYGGGSSKCQSTFRRNIRKRRGKYRRY